MKDDSETECQYVFWKAEFSVSHHAIDRQHKEILNIINSLYLAISKDIGLLHPKLLGQLVFYTVNHFSMEERLIDSSRYKNYEQHIKEHQVMIRKIGELRHEGRVGSSNISLETLAFLKDWWVNHILKMDKEYIPYLQG